MAMLPWHTLKPCSLPLLLSFGPQFPDHMSHLMKRDTFCISFFCTCQIRSITNTNTTIRVRVQSQYMFAFFKMYCYDNNDTIHNHNTITFMHVFLMDLSRYGVYVF